MKITIKTGPSIDTKITTQTVVDKLNQILNNSSFFSVFGDRVISMTSCGNNDYSRLIGYLCLISGDENGFFCTFGYKAGNREQFLNLNYDVHWDKLFHLIKDINSVQDINVEIA